LTSAPTFADNTVMNTLPKDGAAAEGTADLEYAIQLSISGKRDPEFEKRIRAKTDEIRKRMFAEHGLVNVAVDLIREGRDEE
jgi:hypothetical protein